MHPLVVGGEGLGEVLELISGATDSVLRVRWVYSKVRKHASAVIEVPAPGTGPDAFDSRPGGSIINDFLLQRGPSAKVHQIRSKPLPRPGGIDLKMSKPVRLEAPSEVFYVDSRPDAKIQGCPSRFL